MHSRFNHFDAQGQAHMVDVASKAETHRVARASGCIRMQPETLQMIKHGASKKGDVLGIARLAAIQASKKTADLIPLCHPVALTRVVVEFTVVPKQDCVLCTVTTESLGRTGVEMEALAGVQIGLLTIYDMCKSVDRAMSITDIRLLEKSGGKTGHWVWSPASTNTGSGTPE